MTAGGCRAQALSILRTRRPSWAHAGLEAYQFCVRRRPTVSEPYCPNRRFAGKNTLGWELGWAALIKIWRGASGKLIPPQVVHAVFAPNAGRQRKKKRKKGKTDAIVDALAENKLRWMPVKDQNFGHRKHEAQAEWCSESVSSKDSPMRGISQRMNSMEGSSALLHMLRIWLCIFFHERVPSSPTFDILDVSGLGRVEPKSKSSSFFSPNLRSTLKESPLPFGKDYMNHDAGVYRQLSPDPSESLLSPLPVSWPNNRLSLGAGDIYHSDFMFPGPVGGSKDVPVTEGDEDDFCPDFSFSPLPWTSPSSVDTDLDDDSLTSSTSSLSPDYQDTHSPLESDDEEEFDPNRYFSQLSSPMHHDDHRYHIDQYPSHFDLYDEALSPLSLSSPHQRRLSPESHTASPPALIPDSFGLPPSPQWSLYNIDGASTCVPCSPSRRRSADLPLLDEDPFGLQEGSSISSSSLSMDDLTINSERHQRWLSLPGAETDDDLIPRELGSKNYIPDPTIAVPTTPPSPSTGSLLLWDVDGDDDIDRRRPISPEDFDLDPAIFADLPDDETGAEAQKIYQLKQRTTGRESWEREKSRELSTLLRLKLKLDETGSPSSHASPLSSPPSSVSAAAAPTDPVPSSCDSPPKPSPCLSSIGRSGCTAPPTYRIPHRKPSISSMDQLVANMVFHRQQESSPLRKKPVRARTWSPPDLNARSHPTPKSPLRQVLLPEDMEEVEEGLGQLVESPLPLSPLCLEADLAMSMVE
ncbi:hypothetical protein BDN70DRAFT_893423 [Pholiota conissans]|uniref:Uncharacterized protein n=1 Tax=Pholiota conissans TaxID=109636 RepID=A0A9P6D2C7_9AGAR|nr:hypothetical protein BDN70DRAFT_893423 [Pholiota conissans]